MSVVLTALATLVQGPTDAKDVRPRVAIYGVNGIGKVPLGCMNKAQKRLMARFAAVRNAVDKAIKETAGATKGFAEEYVSEEFDGTTYKVVVNVLVW